MKTKEAIQLASTFAKAFRISDGSSFSLKDIDPGDTLDLSAEDRPRAKEALATGVEALAALQDMLYAQARWAVLLVFQAMDAAARTVPSSTSCPGLTPKAAKCIPSKSRRRQSSITISFGDA